MARVHLDDGGAFFCRSAFDGCQEFSVGPAATHPVKLSVSYLPFGPFLFDPEAEVFEGDGFFGNQSPIDDGLCGQEDVGLPFILGGVHDAVEFEGIPFDGIPVFVCLDQSQQVRVGVDPEHPVFRGDAGLPFLEAPTYGYLEFPSFSVL